MDAELGHLQYSHTGRALVRPDESSQRIVPEKWKIIPETNQRIRRDANQYQNISFSDVIQLDGVKGRRIDMELTVRPEKNQELFQKFAVRFAQNEQYHTSLSFRPRESILKIDRKHSGSRRAIIHQRRRKINQKFKFKGRIKT